MPDQSALTPLTIDSTMPLVSVVIPAYNAEAYVADAICSAQHQTLADIEIIVIDDASTDRTPDILRAIATDDRRVRCVRMDVNSGPGASRNRGMAMARGDWIALLDADDTFHPRRLETLLAFARGEMADVVADNVQLLVGAQPAGLIIPETRLHEPRTLQFREFIDGSLIDPNGPRRVNYVFMHPMFRREFLNEHGIAYNDLSRNGEDFLFYVECFLAGGKWFMVPEPMYFYSVRDGSLTEIQTRDDLRRMVSRVSDLLQDARVRRDKELARSVRHYWTLIAGAYHWFGLKEAVLAADLKAALRAVFRDADSARLIGRELLVRAPAIGRRLVRKYI